MNALLVNYIIIRDNMDFKKTKAVKEVKQALRALHKSVRVTLPPMEDKLSKDILECYIICFEGLDQTIELICSYLDDCIMEGVIKIDQSLLTYEKVTMSHLSYNIMHFQAIFSNLDIPKEHIDYIDNFLYTQDVVMSGFFNFLKEEIYPEMNRVDCLFVTKDKIDYMKMSSLYIIENMN
jgi:hypothetical protein